MRRNLLCFVTGAVVTLAVVLLVRSGNDSLQPSAASNPPAAVDTTAREPAPNVRLRGRHDAPHGHRRARRGTTSSASSSSSSSQSPSATPSHAASAARPSTPRRTGTTPTVPPDDTPTVPDDGTGTPPTDTGTTPPPGDGGSGADSGATTPQTDSAVTIPNQATPDGSVGTP